MSADLAWTRERLSNWGAWSRDRRHFATAYSAEGRYRPERLAGDTEADRRRARRQVDVLDALTVWRAILPARGMPISSAMVLHGVYAHNLRDRSLRAWLARHGMSVRGRDLDGAVHQAELAAHNRLQRMEGKSQMAAFQSAVDGAVEKMKGEVDEVIWGELTRLDRRRQA